MLLLNLIFFSLTSVILIISSTFVVLSLNKIAHFLRISKFIAAFVIMAFATCLPELFIGISSAITNNTSLSLGNVIGSSIVHFTILAGIFIMMGKGIKLKSEKMGKENYFVLFSVILFVSLGFIGSSLSRIDGIILILFFLLSSYSLFKRRNKYRAKLEHKKINRIKVASYFVTFFISLLILFFSSKYLVEFSSLIASDLKLPELVIGLLLLSLSTNLPELAFGIKAISLGYKEMALGDLTGGVLTNLGLVIGVVAIITPIPINLSLFAFSAIFLLISSIIFMIFLRTRHELSIIEGVYLIFFYLWFILIEFFMK